MIINIITASIDIFVDMSAYILFGFIVAGISFVLLPTDYIKKTLGKAGVMSILKGSLLGIPLPLCSCSVLPVAVSIKRQGASKGSVASFLLSTPQTGVDSIIVTWSFLGPVFAIFRVVAAFISGIIGGVAIEAFSKEDNSAKSSNASMPLTSAPSCSCSCSCKAELEKDGEDKGCRESGCMDALSDRLITGIKKFGYYSFIEMPDEIGPSLIIGILFGGIIETVVPNGIIEASLGGGIKGLLFALLLGLPVYVCATSSVPIAVALLLKGASQGAAFVFLMAGPLTNTAQLTAIYNIFGKRDVLIYIMNACICAMAFGALLNGIVNVYNINTLISTEELLPLSFKVITASLLALLIGRCLLYKAYNKFYCNHN